MWDLWSGAARRALDTCFRQGQKDLDSTTAAVRERRMTLLAERRALREKKGRWRVRRTTCADTTGTVGDDGPTEGLEARCREGEES
eukprot:1221155-Pyramimonas_sp.AAC.1